MLYVTPSRLLQFKTSPRCNSQDGEAPTGAFFLLMEIEQLKGKHKGETCAVLGGGVSLPNDVRAIKPVDRLIGINQHSMILDLDYLVYLDSHLHEIVSTIPGLTLITKKRKHCGTNVVHAGVAPPIGYSGLLAIWVADYLGFERIDVCGMDQYQKRPADREYWWEGPQALKMQRHHLATNDLKQLKAFLDDKLQHPERVFFVSGRLKEAHQ